VAELGALDGAVGPLLDAALPVYIYIISTSIFHVPRDVIFQSPMDTSRSPVDTLSRGRRTRPLWTLVPYRHFKMLSLSLSLSAGARVPAARPSRPCAYPPMLATSRGHVRRSRGHVPRSRGHVPWSQGHVQRSLGHVPRSRGHVPRSRDRGTCVLGHVGSGVCV
jgi:hypothetical protein